jgi:serine/threonine-protein kinase
MADVFVSYKAEDRRRVKPLVDALQTDGLSVWWDAEIAGGDEWRERIQEYLDAAACVVVVWSSKSVAPEGKFVRDEASRAERRGVYLPVRIDKVDPPLGFGETQAISLVGWKGSRSDPRYTDLLSAVRATMAGRPFKRARPAKASPDLNRRALVVGGAAIAASAAAGGAWLLVRPHYAAAADTIAVLPFENISGDPAQSYFSDGIAEEIRTALARIGLQVVGRTSSEVVKTENAEAAARKLGVANIVTGSVRRSPTMVRISAQLIRGGTGLERWSQDYDRPLGDVLAIQTDIAQSVAQALSIVLGNDLKARLTIGGTSNPAAQDLYLKGMARFETEDSEQAIRKSIDLFDAAVSLDSKYALAYGAKAAALNELTASFPAKGKRYDFTPAAALARQAIALQPDLADAHGVLAYILLNALDFPGAAAEFGKARSLPGSDAIILELYSGFVAAAGNPEAAFRLASEAQARDPLNPDVYSAQAFAIEAGGKFARAVTARRKALQFAPDRALDRTSLAYDFIQLGEDDQAAAELAKTPEDFFGRLTGEAILAERHGSRRDSEAATARIQQIYGDTANYQLAQIYAQRGDRDRAFAALDRAWLLRDPGLLMLKTDAFLKPLRTDPRFAVIERKLNYPATT